MFEEGKLMNFKVWVGRWGWVNTPNTPILGRLCTCFCTFLGIWRKFYLQDLVSWIVFSVAHTWSYEGPLSCTTTKKLIRHMCTLDKLPALFFIDPLFCRKLFCYLTNIWKNTNRLRSPSYGSFKYVSIVFSYFILDFTWGCFKIFF